MAANGSKDVRALVNLRPSELTYASDLDLRRQLGVIKSGAKWPELASIDNRLRTFVQAGDLGLPVTTQALCEAGFFYQVFSGGVICFCCGGALRDWQDDDNPWVEHARHFPECGYLQLKKGTSFVDAVQKLAKDGNIQITQEMVCAELGQSPFEFELSTTDYERMAQELGSLEKMCGICTVRKKSVVYLPCGHIYCCVDCGGTRFLRCPVCRQQIKGVVRCTL